MGEDEGACADDDFLEREGEGKPLKSCGAWSLGQMEQMPQEMEDGWPHRERHTKGPVDEQAAADDEEPGFEQRRHEGLAHEPWPESVIEPLEDRPLAATSAASPFLLLISDIQQVLYLSQLILTFPFCISVVGSL